MSLDRIINMVINQLLRRGINVAINAAMRLFARRGSSSANATDGQATTVVASEQDQKLRSDAVKRAKIAARTIRKL